MSGTSISFDTPVVYENASSYQNSVAFDSTNNKIVISYIDAGNSSLSTAVVFTNSYIDRSPIADGDNARVDIIGSVSDNQLSLTPGEKSYML